MQQYGARNQINATVTSIKSDEVMSLVEVRGFSTGADGLRSYYRVCGGPRSQGGRRGAVGDKSRPRFTRQRLRSRDNPYDTLGPIFTESPRRGLLGNPYSSSTRIPYGTGA